MVLTPPTTAISQSPAAIACTARCSATSELEHAVSYRFARPVPVEEIADPVRPHRRHRAGGGIAVGAAVVARQIAVAAGGRADEHADRPAPNDRGAWPASSIAFQTCVISRRCCGSISTASRGEMPKNSGSNSNTPAMKPARWTLVRPGWVLGSPSTARQSQSRPVAKACQSSRTAYWNAPLKSECQGRTGLCVGGGDGQRRERWCCDRRRCDRWCCDGRSQ